MNFSIPDSPDELSKLIGEISGQYSPLPGPDDNIFDLGLDSLRVFSLLASWNSAGMRLDYPELASAPTVRGWWQLIQKSRGSVYGQT